MKKYIAVPIAVGISVGLLAEEVHGEGSPHAEFVAVAPTSFSSNIAMSNTAANMLVYDVATNFTPAEWKIPHQRLVVQTAELPVE